MTSPIAPTVPGGASPSPITSATAGGEMGKNEFIKLLVAQMTHQDPLNPMDGQQMASQLAQFSSVEQLLSLGTKLDAQTSAYQAMYGAINNSTAVGLIGKTVTVVSDQVAAGAGGTLEASVMVPPSGGAGTLRVLDGDGNTVRTIDLGQLESGELRLDVPSALDGLPAGPYRIAVELRTGTETVALSTRIAVQVDGVRTTPEGAFVTAGAASYSIGLIESIRAGLPTS